MNDTIVAEPRFGIFVALTETSSLAKEAFSIPEKTNFLSRHIVSRIENDANL